MIKEIDPHVASSAHARYSNKFFTGDVIFICTNKSILNWFLGDDECVRDAFFRRLNYVITFDSLSQDMVASITVNKIQSNKEQRYLLPIQERKFDLKPYITERENSKDILLDTLDDLTD